MTTQADAVAPVETLASNLDYTAFGPVTALDLGNGMATDLTYDQDYRLTGLVTGDGVTSVQDLVYGYDLASNITSIDDGLDIGRSQAFGYDGLHRLTQGSGLYGQIDYAYDPVGNRTDRTVTLGGSTTIETSTLDIASNRLMSVDDGTATRSLAYNAAGDLESDTRGLSAYDLDYDQAGRLAYTALDGAATANSLYNAKGERCVMVAGGIIEHSLYDREGRLIARFDAGAGTPSAAAGEIVLDNGDAGTSASGTWAAASLLPGHQGADYLRHDRASELDSYSWTTVLPAANRYAVYATWPRDPNRGAPADYTVSHDGGTTNVSLDQIAGGGQWNLLGSFDMTPGLGHGVALAGTALAAGVAAESEVVIDNGDAGTSALAAWTASSATTGGRFHGRDFLEAGPGGLESFTWPAAVPEAGRWQVYVRWSAGAGRATDAPYTVTHSGGSTTVSVDQTISGGVWMPLGSYDFDPLKGHGVRLTNQAGGSVSADAVRLVRDAGASPAQEVTVDNQDPGATAVGTWSTSTWNAGGNLVGSDFRYTFFGNSSQVFTWPAAVPEAGTWRVYARWSAATNRVSAATYQVHHAGGMTPVSVNQKGSGGIWVALGDFDLDPAAGHKVELLGQGSGGFYVIADAVRYVKAGSGSSLAGEIVVDNTQASKAGSWTTTGSTVGGTFWGPNFEYRSGAGTGANTMTWTPALVTAGRYKVYAMWTAEATRASDAPYTITHDGGSTTVRVDQKASGGSWVPLGFFDFTPGLGQGVVLSDDAAGTIAGDAVRFVPDANSRAVMADAVKFVPAETPSFPVASSSLLDEVVYLNGRPLAMVDGGTLYYIHPDHLGTPQRMTDGSGAVVWDAVYRPFGEAESITGSAQNDLRFPGQLYDVETGLHYNYFRDYAPGLGRYLQSDPIGLDGGVNRYLYAGANPVTQLDLYGLKWKFIGYEAVQHNGWWSHYRITLAVCKETCLGVIEKPSILYEQWRPININTPPPVGYDPNGGGADPVNGFFDLIDAIIDANDKGTMSGHDLITSNSEAGTRACASLPEATGLCCEK